MAHGNTRTMVAEGVPPLHVTVPVGGVPAGTTWGDFKRAVESQGVQDNDPLDCIEYGNASTVSGHIGVDFSAEGVGIREVR